MITDVGNDHGPGILLQCRQPDAGGCHVAPGRQLREQLIVALRTFVVHKVLRRSDGIGLSLERQGLRQNVERAQAAGEADHENCQITLPYRESPGQKLRNQGWSKECQRGGWKADEAQRVEVREKAGETDRQDHQGECLSLPGDADGIKAGKQRDAGLLYNRHEDGNIPISHGEENALLLRLMRKPKFA